MPRHLLWLLCAGCMLVAVVLCAPAVLQADDPLPPAAFEMVMTLENVNHPHKAVFNGLRQGNPVIVVTDTRNHCIKEWVAGSGEGTTVLAGTCGTAGDTLGNSPGETLLNTPVSAIVADYKLYIADTGNHRILASELDAIVQIQPFDAEQQLPVDIDAPLDLAVYEDAMYVADGGAHRVLGIDIASGDVLVQLGTGEPGYNEENIGITDQPLNRPAGLAAYATTGGNLFLYVLEAGNRLVREYSPADGVLRPRVGDPWSVPQVWPPHMTPAALLAFKRPFRISVNNNLTGMIITDPAARRVWIRSAEGFVFPLELPFLAEDTPTYSAEYDASGENLVTTHPDMVVWWRRVVPQD